MMMMHYGSPERELPYSLNTGLHA